MSAIRCTYPKFRSILETPFTPNNLGKVFVSGNRSRASSTVYTTPQKTATITNPVVLDANGEKNVFVEASTDYTFSFSDSVDDPLDTIDECLEVVEPITTVRTITGTATIGGGGALVELIKADPIPARVKTARFMGRVSSSFPISEVSITRYNLAPTIKLAVTAEPVNSTVMICNTPWYPVTEGEMWVLQAAQQTGGSQSYTGVLGVEFRYED